MIFSQSNHFFTIKFDILITNPPYKGLKIDAKNYSNPLEYESDKKFYSDLSGFVNGQREEYYKLEEACMETVRQQNSMLDSFPNVMYNKVLGIQKLQYNPGFTSTHTEHVFKTKREDI